MKAFLINTIDETITEVDHDDSDYKNISKAIDAKYFTTVQIHEDGDTIYLDDEGLLHGNHKHTFTLDKVFNQTFVGKGLVSPEPGLLIILSLAGFVVALAIVPVIVAVFVI